MMELSDEMRDAGYATREFVVVFMVVRGGCKVVE